MLAKTFTCDKMGGSTGGGERTGYAIALVLERTETMVIIRTVELGDFHFLDVF